MTWLQFISDMVGHLAWPIVVLIVLYAIRKHLGSFAQRVLELSFPGLTLKFDKLLSEGSEIIEHAPLPKLAPRETADDGNKLDEQLKIYRRLEEIRSRADIGQILTIYADIEQLIKQLGEAVGRPNQSVTEIMRYLRTKELLPDGFEKLFENLREGRNIVAHRHAALSQSEIEVYLRQASFFKASLTALLGQIRSGERGVPD
jgi:uncharacterized protein YutE (UPF0331/DUF86 family)